MSTVPLPLYLNPENRDTTNLRDARLVNGFWEQKSEKAFELYKRTGVVQFSDTTNTGQGRGIYNWEGALLAMVGTNLYTISALGVAASVGTFTAPTWNSPVIPVQGNLAATQQLLIQTGNGNAVFWNGSVVTAIVGFPANTVPGAVYLDETMYVMDTQANIWGSGLEDLTTWNTLNKIQAYIEPGLGVALYKQLAYVVAFKSTSVEVFYDAAVPGSPTPLGPVQGAKVNFGCAHAGSIQDLDGKLVWMCTSKSAGYGIMQMENVQAQAVSTPAVNRRLQAASITGDVHSWQLTVRGHQLYGVTFKDSNFTLVYDLTSHMWAEWSVNGGRFPIVSSCVGLNNEVLLQGEADGVVYRLDPATYIDQWKSGSSFIVWEMYTPNWDGDTELGKLFNEVKVIADQQTGSTLQMRYSDDDYQTWSDFKDLDLSQKEPFVEDLGTANRRAFHFKHSSPTNFRMSGVKMRVDICTL